MKSKSEPILHDEATLQNKICRTLTKQQIVQGAFKKQIRVGGGGYDSR